MYLNFTYSSKIKNNFWLLSYSAKKKKKRENVASALSDLRQKGTVPRLQLLGHQQACSGDGPGVSGGWPWLSASELPTATGQAVSPRQRPGELSVVLNGGKPGRGCSAHCPFWSAGAQPAVILMSTESGWSLQ